VDATGGGGPSPADEAALVTRAKAGDSDAFAALVRPHLRTLHNVCYRITGNDSTAEDATQAALLAAWRYIGRFERRARFSTWLYQIAHNAALAETRKRVPEPLGAGDELPAGHRRGPEEGIVTKLSVQDALGRIPPDFRAAVVLREYGGLSYEEIAAATGIRVETVKTRIARGRQAVARLLRER
jgi:RNA polymerase sigma-70 factor (ECF subfamily)